MDGIGRSLGAKEQACRPRAHAFRENGCAEPQFSFNGPTSINCIGCHASAISGSSSPATLRAGTFSTPQFCDPAAAIGTLTRTLPLFFPPIQTPAAPIRYRDSPAGCRARYLPT